MLDLKKSGATDVVLENAEVIFETSFVFTEQHRRIHLVIFLFVNLSPQTCLQLGSILLRGLGVMSDDVSFLSTLVRNSMEVQAQEALKDIGNKEVDIMKPLQVLEILKSISNS